MTRIHFLALMSLLGGSLVLAGCGDDGGDGDPAGGSGGVMGGSGGSGGDGGSGGTGGGIMCENHEGTCTPPIPVVTQACCTDEGRCGVNGAALGYGCVWTEGETSDECPDETATADDFTDAGTAETDAGAADAGEPQGITLPGCCKPNNQCGIELSFGGFSLGVCIQRSDVMQQDLEDVGCTYQGE